MCDSKKDQNLTRVAKSGADIGSSNFLDLVKFVSLEWNKDKKIKKKQKTKQPLPVIEYIFFPLASKKDAKVG